MMRIAQRRPRSHGRLAKTGEGMGTLDWLSVMSAEGFSSSWAEFAGRGGQGAKCSAKRAASSRSKEPGGAGLLVPGGGERPAGPRGSVARPTMISRSWPVGGGALVAASNVAADDQPAGFTGNPRRPRDPIGWQPKPVLFSGLLLVQCGRRRGNALGDNRLRGPFFQSSMRNRSGPLGLGPSPWRTLLGSWRGCFGPPGRCCSAPPEALRASGRRLLGFPVCAPLGARVSRYISWKQSDDKLLAVAQPTADPPVRKNRRRSLATCTSRPRARNDS